METATVLIPWYATIGRGDALEAALLEASATALEYGALAWEVLRSKDDRYRFQQTLTWRTKADFDRYWAGEEMQTFRAESSSWYQVPVLYNFQTRHAGLAPSLQASARRSVAGSGGEDPKTANADGGVSGEGAS